MSTCAVILGKGWGEAAQTSFCWGPYCQNEGCADVWASWRWARALQGSEGSWVPVQSCTNVVQVSTLGLAGVWSLCVGRGVWVSLHLSVQACSVTAASSQTSWFDNSPAILHYAVTPVTAVQIFAGLCSGVWPLHPAFGGCRSWIKLCLGCSFCSAPLRAKIKSLLVSTKSYRELKFDEKQNNPMHSEKADIKTTVRNSVLCL